MKLIIEKMVDGPFSYSFGERNQHVLPHEALPLGPLRIVNRGRTLRNNQIRLQLQPNVNHIPIQELVEAHAGWFVVPEISFHDRRFVLCFGEIFPRLFVDFSLTTEDFALQLSRAGS